MTFIHIDDLTEEAKAKIFNQWMPVEVNVVILNDMLTERDLDMVFGPWRDEDITVFVNEGVEWHKILTALGCFKSNSDAQRSGWRKPVQNGMEMFRKRIVKPPNQRLIWSFKSNVKPEDGEKIFTREDIEKRT